MLLPAANEGVERTPSHVMCAEAMALIANCL